MLIKLLVIQWGSWSSWSSCTKTCGQGLKSRTRKCDSQNCDDGDISQSEDCNSGPCCPRASGWKGFRDKCYRLLTDYKDMNKCRADCQRLGGELASVHSEEENNFIWGMEDRRPERNVEQNIKYIKYIMDIGKDFPRVM